MPKVKPKATSKASNLPKTPRPPKLTIKQKLFCKEYIIDFNATRSAKAAGYSAKSAQVIGVENLLKPIIRFEIDKEIEKREIKSDRSADEVIKRLWEFSDLDKNKYNGGKTVNIKATELLARHYGLFNDKITVKTSLEDLIAGRDKANNAEEKT